MKKNAILVLFVLSILSSCSNAPEYLEIVSSKFDDGTPEVICTFKGDTSIINKINETAYYPSGRKKGEATFSLGKENGKFQVCFESGNLKQSGFFKDGEVLGVLTNYYDQIPEQKSIERFYKDGKLFFERSFHKNGTKMSESNFKNGREYGESIWWHSNGIMEIKITDCWNGMETKWYSNGAKRTEGMLKDGKRNGVWQLWDSLGVKMPPVNYKE